MALDLTDKTSGGNTLTNTNAVAESNDTPGAWGGTSALFTAASSQYLSIADASQTGLDLATTFTIEFWLKLTSGSAFQGILLKDNSAAPGSRSYSVIVRDNNKLNFFVTDGSGNYDDYRYDTALDIGQWNHWAVTCNTGNASASTFEVFKNGASVGNGVADSGNANIATINNSTAALSLGGRPAQGDLYLNGRLFDVRVWNTVRTALQISQNYNKRLLGNESGLVAYYPFEDISPKSLGASPSSLSLLFGI